MCVGVENVFTLQSDDVGQYWPVIVKFLLMVESPDWTTDDVFEAIRKKEAQVWGMEIDGEIQGIWITRVEMDRELYGWVWIAAGKGIEKGLYLFLNTTENWFRELGCKSIRLMGRRGWKKVLPGYVEHAIELRKTL